MESGLDLGEKLEKNWDVGEKFPNTLYCQQVAF
jgi:hypothetical protein